uniref:DUF4350 domain-containing protein n=1 Tax=Panagrolaimus davidi TaxID=227884 RepID=A0A914P1W0_9BILA
MRIYASELNLMMNLDQDIQISVPPSPQKRTTSPIRWKPGPSHKKRNYTLAAIAVFILYIYFYVDFSSKENVGKTFAQIFDLNNLPKNLVIISATLNPRYLFVLPISIASWKKLGVQPIVILVGDKSAFYSNKQSRTTLQMLDEQNAYIQFIEPKKISPTSMSQVSD